MIAFDSTSPQEPLKRQNLSDFYHYGALKINHWPDLHAIPDPILLNTTRLCALLVMRPTSVSLLPHLLDISPDTLLQCLYYLHDNNCLIHQIEVPSNELLNQNDKKIINNNDINNDIESELNEQKGVFKKIWSKLFQGI